MRDVEQRHWLARLPSMIGPVVINAANVQAYRDAGWIVTGPFVLAAEGEATDAA